MKVIIAIGLPGCGKTTLLKPLASKLSLAYINADDIREELTGDPSNHSQEVKVWSIARQRIAKHIKEGGVVIDATHAKRKDRRDMVAFCKENGAKEIVGYWFDMPVELCQQRNLARDRVVPEDVMQSMHVRLREHPPTIEEGFSAIYVIKPDTD